MSPDSVLAWIPAGATAVSVWFLIWILSDFKEFKKHTSDQLDKLRSSQGSAVDKLKECNNEMRVIVQEIKAVQNTYRAEVSSALAITKNQIDQNNRSLFSLEDTAKAIDKDLGSIKMQVAGIDDILKKLVVFVRALKTKIFSQDEAIKTMTVKISEADLLIKKKDPKDE